jgi:hypothetical protein
MRAIAMCAVIMVGIIATMAGTEVIITAGAVVTIVDTGIIATKA